jgi:predicted RNase H-like nuclease (RuvC/YqgF family)
MDGRAVPSAGAEVAGSDMSREEVRSQQAVAVELRAEGSESGALDQIDQIFQVFGDQYVTHLRSLAAALERVYAQRLVERDDQVARLTQQLATQDARLVELRRQLDASEEARAALTARLQATERSELAYERSLRVLDDQVRRLLETHEAGQRIATNEEYTS